MTLDFLKQLINAQLDEKLGPNNFQFRSHIEELNKKHRSLVEDVNAINDKQKECIQKIDKLEHNSTSYLNHGLQTIKNELKKNIKEDINQVNVEMAEQKRNIKELELKIKELSQKSNEKETNRTMFQSTAEIINRSKTSSNKNGLFSQSENKNIQTDNIINTFNSWAANPIYIIPSEFAYITGDFRIRTDQQELGETREESKWIMNRAGIKKYLLPNPNYFDPMTNINELYKMDLNMLKQKGKNKIKIITPCEISSSGFIEFPGELKILP